MQRTYEDVREAIMCGHLKPGSWISQVQLAASLNVSRTPLREALRRLQSEGLVQLDFNRRLRIAPLSLPELESLYALRIAIEPLAVRLSVPLLTSAELDAMACHLRRIREGIDSVAEDEVIEPHKAFHLQLIAHTQGRIRRQVEELWDHSVRYVRLHQSEPNFRLSLISMGHTGHERIFEAAANGAAEEAGRLVAQHLARTALTVIAALAGEHEPRMVREALRFALGSPTGTG
jgi:DNA-binding GntR family transcriptional regulator